MSHSPENKECKYTKDGCYCKHKIDSKDDCLHGFCTCPQNCGECQFESGHALTCSKYVEEKWPKEEGQLLKNTPLFLENITSSTPKEEGWEHPKHHEAMSDYARAEKRQCCGDDHEGISCDMYWRDKYKGLEFEFAVRQEENDERLQKERERIWQEIERMKVLEVGFDECTLLWKQRINAKLSDIQQIIGITDEK